MRTFSLKAKTVRRCKAIGLVLAGAAIAAACGGITTKASGGCIFSCGNRGQNTGYNDESIQVYDLSKWGATKGQYIWCVAGYRNSNLSNSCVGPTSVGPRSLGR